MRAWLTAIAISLALAGPGFAGSVASDARSAPPGELLALEREVGLKVAHERDEGPVEAVQRKLLLDAEQQQARGEQALKAGDYASARERFKRALELLGQIGP